MPTVPKDKMNIKLLLDVDVDDDYLLSWGNRPSKREIGEHIADRLMLNEIGNGDFKMLKEVNGKLIPYGEHF